MLVSDINFFIACCFIATNFRCGCKSSCQLKQSRLLLFDQNLVDASFIALREITLAKSVFFKECIPQMM